MREGVPELQKTEGILAEDLAAEDLSRRPQQKTARWLQDLSRRLKPSCRRLICRRLEQKTYLHKTEAILQKT